MDRRNFASPFPTAPATPTATAPPEPQVAPSMEVAHVLFMDIIGYSKLRMNQQAAAQIELQNLVNACAEVQQAKQERKFICRPTGDGMALLFFRDLVSPVRAALQIHALMDKRAVDMRAAVGAELKMRMGIHSGTVLMVEDLNAQSDAAGDGINIAQRVMDCGDADHILVSSKVADALLNADPWQNYLKDLGEVRVKHGVKVHVYLLRGRLDGAYYGNPGVPKKVEADQNARQAEINKYRGTFWERNPAAKKQIAAAAIAAAVIGVPAWQWKTNPKFQKWVGGQYTGIMTLGGRLNAKNNPKNNGGKSANAGGKKPNQSNGGGRASSGRAAVSMARMVLVPDFVNHSLEEAISNGATEGVRVVRSDKSSYNTEVGEGMIYQQSPSAGASVKEGTRIYVRVSKGDPPDPEAAAAAEQANSSVEETSDDE